MARFNLIDEPWIRVVTDSGGETEEVPLKELFQNAHLYIGLAGDMKTQDFALLRLLLAILHTVFSRVDAQGEIYEWIELDENFRQLNEVDEDDMEDYAGALYKTWNDLWNAGKFPKAVVDYLETWHDRFYLFDEEYPFYQVRRQDISKEKLSKSQGSIISGKNINRRISESNNKTALFAPKTDSNGNKEILNEAELARWILMYQGYCGLPDKVIFGKDKYEAKNSKGWLFDIGGLYLQGETLFETLMLNLVLVRGDQTESLYMQRPCWESSADEVVERYLRDRHKRRRMDNLAELYTLWGRAIYIDPGVNMDKPFEFEVVKFPDIEHLDHFIEPMTIWSFNKQGENKDHYTPRKHQEETSIWRSFGLVTGYGSDQYTPGIVQWIRNDEIKDAFKKRKYNIVAVSMQSDGNATSWVPVNEIVDTLMLHERLLTDLSENGWEQRINDIVDLTNHVVRSTYGRFLYDIEDIRNLKNSGLTSKELARLYYVIDQPFREWIASIEPDKDREVQLNEWKKILKKLVKREADRLVAQAGPRDFTGRICDGGGVGESEGRYKNIAISYNAFSYFLNKQLDVKEG